MDFYDLLAQVVALLQRQGRVSYRTLKRQFHLDDDYLEDLKIELIKAQQLAVDENNEILVWHGAAGGTSPPPHTPQPAPQPTAQDAAPPQSATSPAPPRPPDAERRQLTVLFCDLVDSTRLARQLDPEDWRDVVRVYQQACADVIQRFDGYIAQYLGDGLLVYFGYPQAHEDDAQRAGRASLGLVAALEVLNAQLEHDHGLRLAVRIGVHTGPVVVGAMGGGGRQEQLALGDTPNLAARLQGLAAPNTVVVSAATWGLIEGFFTCQALGTPPLKGVEEPLWVYQLLAESGAQTRLDIVPPRGLTPLVGRVQEVGLLLERWAQSAEGRGQVVLLSGEAGIGKSRLVEVLRAHVGREQATQLTLRCSPYHTNSALYPVITHLHRVLHLHPDDTPAERLDRLEQALRATRLPLAEAVPLFATLLSVPLAERYPPLNWSPQQQRQKTHEAVVAWLVAEAERQPVLAVWEDLHWADPSTLELLGLVLDQTPTAPLYTLLTCRPEFHPPWAPRSYLTQLTLNRLTRPQVEEMVQRITGGKALPAEVVAQIITRTDGVPLFVEELLKMILESQLLRESQERYALTGPLPPLAIPTTLHDALMARLDRLDAAKQVAQLGAMVGREFAYEVLQAVAPLDEATVQQGLARLVAAELLYQRGVPPQATYVFKHALIQEAAYQSLLRSTRQQYHQRIAQTLEAQFPETCETQPELLAQHYTEAGLPAQALGYWQRAGQRALQRSAHVEAVSHVTKGLEVLTTLPDTPARTQHELDLQITLGPALMALKGYTAPEVERTYARARELCQQVGETPRLFPVLMGLWVFYLVRAELQTAYALGEQLLRAAQSVQDPALLLEAHYALGDTLFWLGELLPARTHLEQSLALYDPQQHRALASLYGEDAGVFSLAYMSFLLWWLGSPQQAVQKSQEALTLAQEVSHMYSLALAPFYAAGVHQLRREGQAAQARAEEVLALAQAHGFPFWQTLGMFLRGWAVAEQGQAEEGLAQMHQSLTAYQSAGAQVGVSWFLGMLAETYGQGGHPDEGLTVVAEALAIVHTTGERAWEADLYRLKGELLLQSGVWESERLGSAYRNPHAAEAEACFHQALALARCQQAKSLELRAAMSLARLWQRQSKRTEARQLLAEIYGWFTEGFDTADLQEAKTLLEALGE